MIRARLNRGGWKAVLGFDVQRSYEGKQIASVLTELVIRRAVLTFDGQSIGLPARQQVTVRMPNALNDRDVHEPEEMTTVGNAGGSGYIVIAGIDFLRMTTGATIELDARPLGFEDGTQLLLFAGLNDEAMTKRLMEGDLRPEAWVQ